MSMFYFHSKSPFPMALHPHFTTSFLSLVSLLLSSLSKKCCSVSMSNFHVRVFCKRHVGSLLFRVFWDISSGLCFRLHFFLNNKKEIRRILRWSLIFIFLCKIKVVVFLRLIYYTFLSLTEQYVSRRMNWNVRSRIFVMYITLFWQNYLKNNLKVIHGISHNGLKNKLWSSALIHDFLAMC